MGSFIRFTLIFVLVVLAAFGIFVYVKGRTAPASTTATNSSMASLPSAPTTSSPSPTPASGSPATPAQPQELEPPPDISGLNFPEVSVPGSDIPTPTPPSAKQAAPGDYVSEITSHHLQLPIDNLQSKQLYDSFSDARGGSKHEATDIMEPVGTPVHAIDEGNVVKLFNSKKGGLTIYQFDDSQKYCYYYAHLDRYADNIKEGMLVRAGEVIGYVGSTGDANAASPHLHFAISLLDPDKKYWKGTPLNPYPVLVKLAGTAK